MMSHSEFDFDSRWKKLRNFINSEGLDYLLITNLQNLFWISRTAQYGMLLFPKDGDPALFVRRNFFRAQKETVVDHLEELEKTSQISEYLKKNSSNLDSLKIGMELDSLPASYFLYYKKLLKGAEIKNVELVLRKLRMIKDEKEIERLKNAARVAQKTQEVIPGILQPGTPENEIAAEVMRVAIRNGSMHFNNINSAYGGNWFILTSGEDLWTPSSFPILSGGGFSKAVPIGYSERRLKERDIVMCDFGVLVEGYHADHARTYYVESPPDRFKERYLSLKNIYLNAAEDYLRDGVRVRKIYEEMHESLEKEGLGDYFQGDDHYYQGLGHGIGLELDEPPYVVPKTDEIFEEDMVISLEPKVLIPGWGAIDLEDNFIVRKGKPERITKTSYLFE